MPNVTPDERVDALNKICYNKGDDTFMRSLTESEIAVEKDNFLDFFKEEQSLKEEAKESAQMFAKKINFASQERAEAFEAINSRQREVRDKLYWVIDAANNNMNFFDRYGELIKSRKLTPDETNGTLFNSEGAVKEFKELPFLEPEHVSDVQDIDFEEMQEADGTAQDENATVVDDETQEDEPKAETGKKPKKPRKTKETPAQD